MIGLQRARILGAAVGVLADLGYAGFTASAVCGRAGVSRRTFYEVFENREQCFVAVLADAQQRVSATIAAMGLDRLAWGERVRIGLWTILCLADEDPALARVCVVESQRAGGDVQRERERIIAGLVDALDEGRVLGARASATSRLTAEALAGAVIAVIASRLSGAPGKGGTGRAVVGRLACQVAGGNALNGLLGELTGMILLPYEGPAMARRQAGRELPSAPATAFAQANPGGPDPLAALPMRLTYRTARVLQAVAQLTGTEAGMSNRQIAERAGIVDAGQASKLLARLAQYGLLENTVANGRERGEANQWRLTQVGRRVVLSIGAETQTYRRENRRGSRQPQLRQRGERIA